MKILSWISSSIKEIKRKKHEKREKKRKEKNLLNEAERKKVQDDFQKLIIFAEDISNQANIKSRQYIDNENTTCPHCGTKTIIVDKIRNVTGSGKVSGSFSFGTGSISGSSSTKTEAVNHCNTCGDEWKKTKSEYTDKWKIIVKWIWHIAMYVEEKYSFGLDSITLLQQKLFYAETIYSVFDDASGVQALERENINKERLSLSQLREFFPSVYDSQVSSQP